ncbi:MAG: PQQ-dependent sugar dehydrogenase, partial [Actinomycetota bacterium]|nr:PQQ-dependent sugar dehydrogenase [Actinomycetota bacterium]
MGWRAVCNLVLALTAYAGLANAATVRLEEVAGGLTMPVVFAVAPDGTGRQFVAEQIGRVRIVGPDGQPLRPDFLDLRPEMIELHEAFDERGLLGFEFHPEFADNGLFYVSYSGPPPGSSPGQDGLALWERMIVRAKQMLGREAAGLEYWSGSVHVVERRVSSEDPNRADPDYARVLLTVDQPQYNHNGGWLGFGPDGYLYLGFGDGGNADDVGEGHAPEGNGQAPGRLLGKILRIGVNGDPYTFPEDNPFVGQEGWRPEIYALGFRNPWRCSFDTAGARALFCGDVGQNAFEEVSIVEKGGNYGWRRKEGRHCFDPANADAHPESCPDDDLIDPIIEYENCTARTPCLGRSVIGGDVYRGAAIPDLRGRYV